MHACVFQILSSYDLCPADVNECTSGADWCHPNSTCYNTQGSYTCSCNTGYIGNGFSCFGKLNSIHIHIEGHVITSNLANHHFGIQTAVVVS